MRHRLVLLVLGSLVLIPSGTKAQGNLSLFGYAGTAGPGYNYADDMAAAKIPVNTGTVGLSEVWSRTNLGEVTAEFQSRGMKTALFLQDIFFIRTPNPASQCFVLIDGTLVRGRQRLRGNWQSRLANFVATNGEHISPEKTAFLVVHAEVNSLCVPLHQVETAAKAVKDSFPQIPTVMGYSATHVAGTGFVSLPAPEFFPPAIDWIALWSYGIFDPGDPSHPNNANRITGQGPDFYNPLDRFDPSTTYGELLTKLEPHQRVVFVLDANWDTGIHGYLGWPKWFLRHVARNTYEWAAQQPEIVALIPFLWDSPDPDDSDGSVFLGTVDLPQGVKEEHAAIGAAIVR